MDDPYGLIVGRLESEFGFDPAALSRATRLEDLDLDSLSLAELAVMLEEETGVKVEHLAPAHTLGDLADQLDATAATPAATPAAPAAALTAP